MSDISILSAQFGELSQTVDQVNHAIIVLKAQVVNNGQSQGIKNLLELDEGEVEHATEFMRAFVDRLILLERRDVHSSQLLPNEAVSQLDKTVLAETPDFFDQLRSIQSGIKNQELLNPVQLELLDQIVEALDQERSELFKKLRAARG